MRRRRSAIISSFLIPLLIMVAGLLLLLAGGELLVGGASDLARRWGMPPLLIGLTVVAFGTSVPELFISLAATWRGHPEVMLGNVIGSNIANIGLILGICLLLAPLRLAFKVVAVEMILLHLVTAVLFGLALYGFFPSEAGWLFVAALAVYTVMAWRSASGRGRRKQASGIGAADKSEARAISGQRKQAVSDHGVSQVAASGMAPRTLVRKPDRSSQDAAPRGRLPRHGWPLALLLVVAGLVALAGGAELFLRGAVEVARNFGVSELVIGLTLAAIGTSLPELATCFAAIRQRQDALLVGNIIGSNLFNLLMVMGLTASLIPFALPPILWQRDLPVMLLFSLALLLAIAYRGRLGRWLGAALLAGYVTYLYILV